MNLWQWIFGKKEEKKMTNRVWQSAFNLILINEGGYVCDKDDAGGETKYGICKKSYPNEDICNMTIERAEEIYKRDYWQRCQCDFLPDCLSVAVLDFAVNSGCKMAIKKLQKALGVTQDGIIGNQTIGAANRLNPKDTLEKYMDSRLQYVLDIIKRKPSQKKFENGWTKRIERVRKFCEELI
jgi:lysozyme family protein